VEALDVRAEAPDFSQGRMASAVRSCARELKVRALALVQARSAYAVWQYSLAEKSTLLLTRAAFT